MSDNFASSVKLAEALRQGKMVILLDDESRENEGDLIAAASLITADTINFMAKNARGLICLTLTEARAQQLQLPLMVSDNQSAHSTNFTVSIEAREGVSTGISAHDRAHTILTAVKPDVQANELIKPGHVFPLIACDGGVLVRAGHTEAGCDLVGLAGLEPASVIVEILNEDGTMARRNQLEEFANKHGLLIGSIEDLIQYRLANEQTVKLIKQTDVALPQGEFTLHGFADSIIGTTHIALSSKIECNQSELQDEPVLVRVHQYAGVSDLLGLHQTSRWSLQHALDTIGRQGGLLVLLNYPHDSDTKLQELLDSKSPQEPELHHNPFISLGTGAQILRQLGISKMRLMSSHSQYGGLTAFGLEIVELVEPPD